MFGKSLRGCITRCLLPIPGSQGTSTSFPLSTNLRQGYVSWSIHVWYAPETDCPVKVALLVISACGFNMRLRWDESPTRDHLSNSVDDTIVTVSTTLLGKLLFPSWVFNIPTKGCVFIIILHHYAVFRAKNIDFAESRLRLMISKHFWTPRFQTRSGNSRMIVNSMAPSVMRTSLFLHDSLLLVSKKVQKVLISTN